MIYNNAVGVPNPDGWELTTDSSGEVTWKAYEEVHFNPNLIQRWVREGDEYVNRMTKEQMEVFKKASEPVAWKVDQLVFSALSSAEHHANIVNIPITPLYTHPMRELTDEEIMQVCSQIEPFNDITIEQAFIHFARAILKKAREK